MKSSVSNWKKRFVSVFVLSIVGAFSVPAFADDAADLAKKDPMNFCIDGYCLDDAKDSKDANKEHAKSATCKNVCKQDSKGATSCRQVCS